MRHITLTPAEYKYVYQGFLFPNFDRALFRREEIDLGSMLDLLEASGYPRTIMIGEESVTTYEINTSISFEFEESEFELLKQIVLKSRPNGLYVRVKNKLVETLEASKKNG